MNRLLKHLGINFHRDSDNYRPRINKLNSVKDREQKASENYFQIYNDDDDNNNHKEKEKQLEK